MVFALRDHAYSHHLLPCPLRTLPSPHRRWLIRYRFATIHRSFSDFHSQLLRVQLLTWNNKACGVTTVSVRSGQTPRGGEDPDGPSPSASCRTAGLPGSPSCPAVVGRGGSHWTANSLEVTVQEEEGSPVPTTPSVQAPEGSFFHVPHILRFF